MGIANLIFVSLLLMQGAFLIESNLECQDLQEEIFCTEGNKTGNCYQLPWSGKCRKTCGRCDECYDAQNIVTCGDELEKGHCGDTEVAHVCSQTCNALSCAQEAIKVPVT
ncbi:uncharacterized protein LOC111346280 [Stylophora pistillata]|uniref:uncharacterized protein LOC111346280 n=1 Tax=Stylophora pistillata TaxID=50429 RepID=UPI000C043627|nr:uncharacterized protein LOC111346280 [Stylophora pistillata]